MKIRKIKDWLQERSEKQFKFINISCAYRIKDGAFFRVGETVSYKGNLYKISEFYQNMIHVMLIPYSNITDLIPYATVEINELYTAADKCISDKST